MDRITRTYFDEFVEQNGLVGLPEERAFEHFAGHLTTSIHYSESFASDEIVVGGGGDSGIDSIGIIVNGTLVTEPEEVEDLAAANGYLDVTFIFTQAERSSNFDSAKIGQFAFGVRDFFSDTPQLVQNEAVKHASRICQRIFSESRYFKKGNPNCCLYYATTGKWTNDANLLARRNAETQDIENLNLFRHVIFDCLGAEHLQRLHRQSLNAIEAEIVFERKTIYPDIKGVEQAYLGLLPAREFLKLIEGDAGEVLTSLFYDNVRHWQDWNAVNSEMRATLSNAESAINFPLLNNGVTVIAKRLNPTGNKILLEDYQVVNGCQTSFVLHESHDGLTDEVMVPVRLIATQDEAIKNAIIKATNRQTEVTEDQFFALYDFPKKLEAFFPTFDDNHKLYYERRSRQYVGVPGVEKVRVVNMTSLIRAFAAMFLRIPHRTTRNYKALLKQIGTDIFNKDHFLEPYYVAAYAHYRLEFYFRNQVMPAELKPARYHLLLGFRMLAETANPPRMNANAMKEYCVGLCDILWHDEYCISLFEKAASHVLAVAAGNLHRDNIRTEPFTERLLERLRVAVANDR